MASFAVELVDKLSRAAHVMERALDHLLGAEKAVTAASKVTQAAVTAAGNAVAVAGAKAASGAAGFQKAAAAMNRLSMKGGIPANRIALRNSSWDRISPGFQANHRNRGQFGPVLDRGAQNLGFLDRLNVATKGLRDWNSGTGDAIEKWRELSAVFMRTPFGMLLGGFAKLGGVLFDIIAYLGDALLTAGKLAIALGAIAAIGFTKLVVEMGAFADKSKRALGFITGSKALGIREFRETVDLSAKLGTNLEDTVDHYGKLRSMQFSAGEASGLVKLSVDLQAITGDAYAAERALRAMTQIKAKGRLQSEELVGQLAEAGVSTVLVYKELEKILGTDRKGVLSLLQGGKIDSDTGLVAVVRALKQKYHVKSMGTIGKDFAENTLTGLWASLKNAPARMFMKIGEQVDTTPLIAGLQLLKRAFDTAFSGGGGVSFVNAMVVGLSKLIPLTIAFAEGFGSGLEGIARALSFGESANVAEWARGAGRGVALFFERVIEVTKKVVPAIAGALSALFEGLNVNQLLADMKGFDWKAFGEGLVTIAKALGSITSALGGATAKAVVGAVGSPVDTATSTLDTLLEHVMGVRGNPLNTLYQYMKGGEDPTSAAPRVEPRFDAEALRNGGMQNHISIPVTIQGGSGDPEEHAAVGKTVADHVTRALRKFADGELAQATG
jgi:tape measure domain-containing protein